jgi:ubiquinone/menaquinone biosynthesis C-methylase UbiE
MSHDESASTNPPADLPDYEPMLAAYHAAFRHELQSMIAQLPVSVGAEALDVACGDGAFSALLAERLGPKGRVAALDAEPKYLEHARRTISGHSSMAPIEYVAGTLEDPPFPPGSFDLVWCAQSLYSLREPVAALRGMARLAKPGGIVAVLEADSLHHLILPWPVEIELAVRAAELAILAEESVHPRKFYVGRRLRSVFLEAGLTDIHKSTWASDRAYPLADAERRFVTEHLQRLRQRIASHLDTEIRSEFERLIDDGSREFLLDQPDFDMTCIDHLVWGRVVESGAGS